MKKWLFAVLLGSALVLGACGGGDDEDSSTDDGATGTEETDEGTVDTAAAEDVYKSSCASCHGGDLSGGAGPDLSAIGDKHSADEIEDIIENGIGSMPAQSQVEADDRELLAGWLADKK